MGSVVTCEKTEKPWGWYIVHEENEDNPYKIKTIYIEPHLSFLCKNISIGKSSG